MRADATCYRHPDRRASVSCQRCNRPICTDCMIEAPVGFHCPEDAKQGGQKVYTSQSLFRGGARQSIVTMAIIAVNVLVFLVGLGQPGGGLGRAVNQLTVDGGLFAPIMAEEGEWYRLVTSGFLHAGLFHLGVNMFSLYNIGPLLERLLGRVDFALAYLFALLSGSLGALVLDPNQLTVGASGAIFGLMGVVVVAQRSQGIGLFDTGLGSILILNFLITFTLSNYISVGGHVGGFLGGLVAGWVLIELPKRSRALPKFVPSAAVVALGLAVVGAAFWAADQWMDPLF
jgi:membrane associated rhomboid family serine protease